MKDAKDKIVDRLSGLGLSRSKVKLIVDDVAAEIEEKERKERKKDAVEPRKSRK